MIGYIEGKVLDTDGKKAIILSQNGVGYEINYGYFLAAESDAKLFVHHHISENDQSLWGFNSLQDKKLFELLKTVNKVGSSKAYPLVTQVGFDAVLQAIMFDQPNVLSQAQGIGKKMAEQIILSLKDKVDKFQSAQVEGQMLIVEAKEAPKNIEKNSTKIDLEVMKDVMMALDSLGYKDSDVSSLVKGQMQNGLSSTEEIIKNVLREL